MISYSITLSLSLFCSSHTGLLGEPKTCQTCSYFWVFVLVVSIACNDHTPDIHMTYIFLSSHFQLKVIFFMKPSLFIPLCKTASSIIFNLVILLFFFSVIHMKGKISCMLIFCFLPFRMKAPWEQELCWLMPYSQPQGESLTHYRCSPNICCQIKKNFYPSFKTSFPETSLTYSRIKKKTFFSLQTSREFCFSSLL